MPSAFPPLLSHLLFLLPFLLFLAPLSYQKAAGVICRKLCRHHPLPIQDHGSQSSSTSHVLQPEIPGQEAPCEQRHAMEDVYHLHLPP